MPLTYANAECIIEKRPLSATMLGSEKAGNEHSETPEGKLSSSKIRSSFADSGSGLRK